MKQYSIIDINNRPISIPKATFDALLQQKTVKAANIVAVYTFLYYTAIWQQTNQPKCTVSYIIKGLGLSRSVVRSCRKQLKQMGLIEDVVEKEKGQIKYHYVRVRFLEGINKSKSKKAKSVHPTKTERVGQPPVNALSNNNTMFAVLTNVQTGSLLNKSEDIHTPFPAVCAGILERTIVAKHKLVKKVKPHIWIDHFRKLETIDGVSQDEISKVLNWYCLNFGKEYVPEVFSAYGFRKKFEGIVASMKRNRKKAGNEPETDTSTTIDLGGGRKRHTVLYTEEDVD